MIGILHVLIISTFLTTSTGVSTENLSAELNAEGVKSFYCDEGSFPCGNSSQCLPQRSWCDKTIDCVNGHDEEFSVCEFRGGFLESFSKKHVPLLARSRNTTTCSLSVYPRMCACIYQDRLNCQSQNLTRLPESLSSNITNLMLQRNSIKLEQNMFTTTTMDKLKYLYLSENEISVIPTGVFRGLHNLYCLDLSDNKIEALGDGMFDGLDQLSLLNLNGNLIQSITAKTWEGTPGLVWLMLDYNRLSFEPGVTMPLPTHLWFLHLEGNQISDIGPNLFSKATNLSDLLLKKNLIDTIAESSFKHMRHLVSINLSFNKITKLPPDLFYYNSYLADLSLGHNPMDQLPETLLQNLFNLTNLDLEGIIIHNIMRGMFDHLKKLNFIKLSRFEYCRYARFVRDCSPKGDGLSNFSNMLASPTLRVLIWIVAMVTISGNVTVLISRLIIKEQHKAHSVFLRNLSASDLLMGIYLVMIGVQDIKMRHIFNRLALEWTDSVSCKLAGVISMVSSEVSVFILTMMTAERFLAVVYPLKKPPLALARSVLFVVIAWVLGLLLSIFPIILGRNIGNFYGSNAVCFPLHINDPYQLGWQYSAFLFLGVNLGAFFTIAGMYTVMLLSIIKTRKNASNHTRLDLVVVRRFTLIVMTDALCWIPIAIIKICALRHVAMAANTHSWLTVLIVPINSALNPLIYSMSTPSFFIKLKQSFKAHSQTSQSTQSLRTFQRDINVILPVEQVVLPHENTATSGDGQQNNMSRDPSTDVLTSCMRDIEEPNRNDLRENRVSFHDAHTMLNSSHLKNNLSTTKNLLMPEIA